MVTVGPTEARHQFTGVIEPLTATVFKKSRVATAANQKRAFAPRRRADVCSFNMKELLIHRLGETHGRGSHFKLIQ